MEKYLNESLDDQFQQIENLSWLPWIGVNYMNLPVGKRLLIVGESHYVPDGENDEGNITTYTDINWTREFILKEGLYNYGNDASNPLIVNLEKTIFNKKPNLDDKIKLWSNVAFFNITQTLLDSIKNRPDHEMKIVGRNAFFQLVKLLKPDICLFGGVAFSDYVAAKYEVIENINYELIEFKKSQKISKTYPRSATLSNKENHKLTFVFVKHPSKYYSWDIWAEFVYSNMGGYIDWIKE